MYKSVQLSLLDFNFLTQKFEYLISSHPSISNSTGYNLAIANLKQLQIRLITRLNKMTYENRNFSTFRISEVEQITVFYIGTFGYFQQLSGIEMNSINKLINPEFYAKTKKKQKRTQKRCR